MSDSKVPANILDRIKLLEEKFEAMGQDLGSYLDGLLYADYLKYWEYIHLDTLLNLQHPKTAFPDEKIFIMYHQITELYFKLILLEIDQILDLQTTEAGSVIKRLKRINNYFAHLSNSFSIMESGMDREQFLKFRMALLPASGFQSGQYRMIELKSTDLDQLIPAHLNDPNEDLDARYQRIYWKSGATELATGKKTLTLKHFEEKYDEIFLQTIRKHQANNLRGVLISNYLSQDESGVIREEMRKFDSLVNIHWRLAHFRSAVRYLHKDPIDIAATGGTNWQKYLPPMFQKVVFFPEVWSFQELQEWGKPWVLEQLGISRP
jgi:tryptophan 2,3-dioxygenase